MLVAVEAGEPADVVAERFLVGCSSVYRWTAAARDEGRRAPKRMGGGPKPLIRGEIEAALRRLLDKNNHLTLEECCDCLAAESGVRVDPWTIGRALRGWTGRERSAASSLLSRSATIAHRRGQTGRATPLPGLAVWPRSGWCFSMKARC